jgi:hypothetical protein
MDTPFFPLTFIVLIIASLALVIIFYVITKAALQRRQDDNSPMLNVPAKVVTKRMNVINRSHNSFGGHLSTIHQTTYYATFEVESGDRIEFCISGAEYGILAEGDCGTLTFQGKRFLAFFRQDNFNNTPKE